MGNISITYGGGSIGSFHTPGLIEKLQKFGKIQTHKPKGGKP